jgi:ribosomal protein S18 acetylase RimI-like enzyme
MTVTIRAAKPDDALLCARLFIMAGHGISDAIYRDLIPGLATEEIIADRRIKPKGRSASYTNWWVAEDSNHNIVGGILAYPLDEGGRSAPEVLLTEERLKVLAPMIELDAGAAGTFYINDVAVFPAYRHAGIGRKLIELAFAEAKKAGLSGVSLTTFEEDRRLVDYYRGFGFNVVASRPIVPHECIEFGGNLILMICPVR